MPHRLNTQAPSSAPPLLGRAARACNVSSARAPVASSCTILMPPQKLPKASQGVPASSSTTLGAIAFQSSPVWPTVEQTTEPWSLQLPLASVARVACPIQDVLLPNVEAA